MRNSVSLVRNLTAVDRGCRVVYTQVYNLTLKYQSFTINEYKILSLPNRTKIRFRKKIEHSYV